MMVPPLSERPVTEEDEEQFRRESMPRKYTLRHRWADYRADARANRPKGMKARVQAVRVLRLWSITGRCRLCRSGMSPGM